MSIAFSVPLKKTNIPSNSQRVRYIFWRVSQCLAKPFFRLYFRHETHGVEHLPDSTGAIVATNHGSILDPPLITVEISRPTYFMAKESLHRIPVFGSLIRAWNSFPIKRGILDRRAMRSAVELIDKGNLVLMFPEGTRTRDGELQQPKRGIGKLVKDAKCPIVPGYIHGTYDALPKGSWFPRPAKTSVHFGPPLYMEGVPEQADYGEIAGEVMESIARLKQVAEAG